MMMVRHRRRRRWLLLAIPVAAIVAAATFVVWAVMSSPPMPESLAALESDAEVEVATDGWLVFSPAGREPTSGLVFYPGGRVDARAYAPLARYIAAEGHLVVIVPMPLNLAFFGANRADDVVAAFPEVEHWAVGGHSLGGAFAAQYAGQHPDKVRGLVLWASYPAGSNGLSDSGLAVASVYGTRDGVATEEEILSSRPLLPADTVWVPIEGGNHAQFGWYGDQSGDNAATISREEQQAQIVSATVQLLASLQGVRD